MPKTSKSTTKRTTPKITPMDQARADKRELQNRIRVEKDVVRLAFALERAIRKSDYRLLELGGALMARGARTNQVEAQRDVEREASIAARPPMQEA